ncbi:unnamed protein product, partial [Thlaspi arvense]
QTVFLAFQHYIVMLGTTVMIATILVSQMGWIEPGDSIIAVYVWGEYSSANLGWGRLPTVMGPSFAYLISVLSVARDLSDEEFPSDHQVCSIIVDC